MSCRAKCSANEDDYQPFSKSGRLAGNKNLSLSTLRKHVTGQATVYCYIITSIKNRDGHFIQTGCGPNFQGDRVTLCTCKHRMRTFLDASDWNGKWVAGFTGRPAGQGRNILVYLMQVSHAFKSHYDLWFSKDKDISRKTKRAKAAHLHKFGDIYKPRRKVADRLKFNVRNYFPACSNHVHAKGWDNDIAYRGCSGRSAALLVGNPMYSFLWNYPMIEYVSKLHHGQMKCEIHSLLGQLKAGRIT